MKNSKIGAITAPLLIITTAFVIVIYGLLILLARQLDYSYRQVASEQSLHIAEAGINYYRWHLAHAPEDYKDGSPGSGPYEHVYKDPQGATIGKYSLQITAPINGSSIVTIVSTGWTDRYPQVKRTIRAKYGIPSLARYSFLQQASGWYGSGITVNGKIHTNTGIRMDGNNTSLVTSAQTSYTCGSETGCSPSQPKPGVWGAGPAFNLWQFPMPRIDFDTISFDFDKMRQSAKTSGIYIAPSSNPGYHIRFNSDGTFNLYKITSVGYYSGYAENDGCQRRYQTISSETQVGTYTVSTKPIIFIENNLWVEGTIKGRITVVAVRFPIDSNSMNIWIPNSIIYNSYDNSNSLGLIAQKDIYFTRNIPSIFKIDAALMAQKGKIIRHGYLSSCGSSSQAVKDQLIINGALISYEKSYWNFGSGPQSGFRTRQITYDANLLYQPPPYFPTSGDYEFISWNEE